MEKLLFIVGPTSSGKTALALFLAKKFDGEIVSADSRQVYKGLDIGTGKDIPKKSEFYFQNPKIGGYYLVDGIPIWGYDLTPPTSQFNVGQYVRIARKIIRNIWGRKKLSIIVGGTGLYIKALVDGIDTSGIPQNRRLRQTLSGRGIKDLFDHLANLDPAKAALLNFSDRNNPRRLIRAIEIAEWNLIRHKKVSPKIKPISESADFLIVGVNASKKIIDEKIAKRIRKRIKKGLIEEIKSLFENGVSWESQSMTSLGYRQWKDYFEGKKKKENTIDSWHRAESEYARRQIVWFRGDKRIKWFDIKSSTYPKNVEKEVNKWYLKPDAKKN